MIKMWLPNAPQINLKIMNSITQKVARLKVKSCQSYLFPATTSFLITFENSNESTMPAENAKLSKRG